MQRADPVFRNSVRVPHVLLAFYPEHRLFSCLFLLAGIAYVAPGGPGAHDGTGPLCKPGDELPDKRTGPVPGCRIVLLFLPVLHADRKRTAPETAPQTQSFFAIPAPDPQAIFRAVAGSGPGSGANDERTACAPLKPAQTSLQRYLPGGHAPVLLRPGKLGLRNRETGIPPPRPAVLPVAPVPGMPHILQTCGRGGGSCDPQGDAGTAQTSLSRFRPILTPGS